MSEQIQYAQSKELDNAIGLLLSKKNHAQSFEHFLDGADVYGATALRCLLQFYFFIRLPNYWEHDHIGDSVVAAVVGGVGAAVLIAFIIGVGAYYSKKQTQSWVKSELTDEFLLAFYAYGYDQSKKTADIKVLQLIEQTSKLNEQEKKRIESIKNAAINSQTNDSIKKHFEKKIIINSKEAPTLKKAWAKTHEFLTLYAYIHWILWMPAIIVLSQAKPGYATDDDFSSGFYSDHFGGTEWPVYLQLLIGAVIAAGVMAYKYQQNNQQAKLYESETSNHLKSLRSWWLTEKSKTESKQPKVNSAVPPSRDFNRTIKFATPLTLTTTFIGNFLLFNIAAWPVAVFVVEQSDPNLAELFFSITLVTSALAVIQTLVTYNKLSDENKAYTEFYHKDDKDKVSFDPGQEKQSFISFYRDNPEHRFRAMYYILGGLLGSGGFLLTRVIFSNGIGNVRFGNGEFFMDESLKTHGQFDDALFIIGAVACVVMIALNMSEYYYRTKRNEMLSDAEDHRLMESAPTKA